MTQSINTLGKALRHQFLLQVDCLSCARRRYYETVGLAMLYGMGRDPLGLRFVCKHCRRRCRLSLMLPDFLTADTVVMHRSVGGNWIERRLGGK